VETAAVVDGDETGFLGTSVATCLGSVETELADGVRGRSTATGLGGSEAVLASGVQERSAATGLGSVETELADGVRERTTSASVDGAIAVPVLDGDGVEYPPGFDAAAAAGSDFSSLESESD